MAHIILAYLATSLLSFAQGSVEIDEGKVVLLTALPSAREQDLLEQELDTTLRSRFAGTRYGLAIIHRASILNIHQALMDRSIKAVFIVAHAANSTGDGIVRRRAFVVDADGLDVSRVLTRVHDNLQVLAVIGCSFQEPLANFRDRSYFKNNPDLLTIGFKETIDPRDGFLPKMNGLSRALDLADTHLGNLGRETTKAANESRPSRDFVTRQLRVEYLPAGGINPKVLQILINGQLQGIIMASSSEAAVASWRLSREFYSIAGDAIATLSL